MKRFIILCLLCFATLSAHSQVSILAGVARFNKPSDGVYWNMNQPHDAFMTPAVLGLRYDTARRGSYSLALQYTHFGTVKMDALAVTTDAPYQGGYIADTGTCVGTCAELARWKMESETQSIALIGVKHFGAWSFEAGLNVYEIRTKGHVENLDGSFRFQYKEGRALDYGPMFGVAYSNGPWAGRFQVWRMEGKGHTDDGYYPPATFREDYQLTATVGYTF